MKKTIIYLLVVIMVCMIAVPVLAAPAKANISINVLLNTKVNDDVLKVLGKHGKVLDVLYEIDALTMRVKADELETIKGLEFVEAANPDAEREGAPIDMVPVENMSAGLSTWNLDAINVTDYGFNNRTVNYDGTGVYIAVLDTGLVDTWRQYFPEERIAEEYAKSFTGGPIGNVAEQPNKWEHDVDSHGTHVTSTILGYALGSNPINGVAPNATVIPVKVLNQTGSGWSSVITKGINYVTNLKIQFDEEAEETGLDPVPVIINMSLGGLYFDPVEKAAIDRAIENGVIVVASAGNHGDNPVYNGMGYPGAYEPVISVAAAGWAGEWLSNDWWYAIDDPDPIIPSLYYIASFSSVEKDGQYLDVTAPGSWILGPYQVNRGKTSYYFMGGTSMACPHVTGIVALMAEKDPTLTAANTEIILESSALDLGYLAENQGAGLVDAQGALNMIP